MKKLHAACLAAIALIVALFSVIVARFERIGSRGRIRVIRFRMYRAIGHDRFGALRLCGVPLPIAGGMGNPNIKPSDRLSLQALLDPVSQGAATVTTGWVSMKDFDELLAIVFVGAFGSSATVDAKLQQAQDSGGTGAKDISNKAITQLLAGGGNNRQAAINLRSDELDQANSFTHARLSVTVGTAATLIAAAVIALDARYQPQGQKATVAQVVA